MTEWTLVISTIGFDPAGIAEIPDNTIELKLADSHENLMVLCLKTSGTPKLGTDIDISSLSDSTSSSSMIAPFLKND
jgi:hypothetical protein